MTKTKTNLMHRRLTYYEVECLDRRLNEWYLFDRWPTLNDAEWSAQHFYNVGQKVRLYGPRAEGRKLLKELGQ